MDKTSPIAAEATAHPYVQPIAPTEEQDDNDDEEVKVDVNAAHADSETASSAQFLHVGKQALGNIIDKLLETHNARAFCKSVYGTDAFSTNFA